MAKEDGNVRSVERALSILECFTRERPIMSLMEIAQEIGLSPSTTARLIATLENKDFLKRDAYSLRYSLGYKLASMGSICLLSEGLRDIARPHLINLHKMFNETNGLYVVDKTERVCIDCVASTQPLQRYLNVGNRMPLTRGAAGKLLMAHLPPGTVRRLIENDPYAPNVTASQLDAIRQDGYATSVNEYGWGVGSVAAPIFNAEHKLEAALFIAAPTVRMTDELIEKMLDACIKAAADISQKLGY